MNASRQPLSATPPDSERSLAVLLEQWLDNLSQSPRLWNLLRWIAEAGYHGERAVIARELQPQQRVGRFLDFGCGTGAFAALFPSERYVGLDLSVTYLRHARQAHQGQFVAASMASAALADQCCDAALVLGVLHHLPDDVATTAMVELHRVLRPGATALVIEDIPPPSAWNVLGHLMHWLDRGGFIRSETEYRAIFGAGFRIVRSYTMRSGICDYGVYVLERYDP